MITHGFQDAIDCKIRDGRIDVLFQGCPNSSNGREDALPQGRQIDHTFDLASRSLRKKRSFTTTKCDIYKVTICTPQGGTSKLRRRRRSCSEGFITYDFSEVNGSCEKPQRLPCSEAGGSSGKRCSTIAKVVC